MFWTTEVRDTNRPQCTATQVSRPPLPVLAGSRPRASFTTTRKVAMRCCNILIFFKSAQLSAFQLLRSGTAYTYSPAIAIKISESPRLRLFGLFAAARRWGCSKKLFGQRAGLSSFDETRRLASSALPLHQVHANGRGHSLLMAAAAAAALAALMEPLPDEAALRDRLSERGLKSARAQATAAGAAA